MADAADRAEVGGGLMSQDELLVEIGLVVPPGRARHLVARARRVAGVPRTADGGAMRAEELLMILESIGAEGGALQAHAEALARRALSASVRGGRT